MRGFQKIHRSNFQSFCLLLAFGSIVFLPIIGCKSSREAERPKTSDNTLQEFLDTYEKTFNPSDYDADVSIVKQEEKRQREAIEAATVTAIAVAETVSGYRIQVLFTQEIDQANEMRENLSGMVPEEWVYVVYDAPYYKVRIGNYIDRPAANQMLKKLVELGFKDAWIVPDNVIKNPPPKPPDTFIEPEKR